ncbi:MAG: SIMPL domain-containing protein [Haloferacaceae archaeon]
MRRKLAVPVLLAALMVLAGCAGTGGSNPTAGASAADAPSRTITVDATGQVQAEPDQAVLRIAVETTADDASTARQRLAENASRMRSALSELGLADDQITTVYYDISQRYERPPREGEKPERTYHAVHAYEITLSDVDRVGEVIDTAVDNGATSVDSVRFTLSRETRLELRKQALTDAMGNARGEADVIASAADLSVTDVARVTTTQVNVGPYREVAYAAAGGSGGTSIDSGPVTVTAQVVVTYNASA